MQEREGEYTAMRFVLPHECVGARITTTMASRSNQELLLLAVYFVPQALVIHLPLEEVHHVFVAILLSDIERHIAIGRLLPCQWSMVSTVTQRETRGRDVRR